nr:uncharacterized protein LOC117686879 [Crassostrea gigas]
MLWNIISNLLLKINLGILADGLKSCQLCSQPLHLNDCTGEKKIGLGHMLLIRCNYCQLVNEIPTGSRHKTIAGGIAWDVNTKLAAGMIDAGLGEMHVNSLLSAMNIPTIPPKSIKCREREIVPHLADMAEETCRKNLEEEVRLSDGN